MERVCSSTKMWVRGRWDLRLGELLALHGFDSCPRFEIPTSGLQGFFVEKAMAMMVMTCSTMLPNQNCRTK